MNKPKVGDFSHPNDYQEAVFKYHRNKRMKKIILSSVAGVVGLVALTVIGGSFYTVDQGERGVLLRNGAITGTAEPGLGFKLPIVDKMVDIDVRTQAQVYQNILAYSRDQQTAGLDVSVNFRIPADAVTTVYSEYGGLSGLKTRLLDRRVMDQTKNVFGRFNAVTAIQERSRLVAEVQMAIQDAVVGPIIIESVQIENIDFSDAYENSIEQRMLAEVEVQKVTQNAEREKVQAEILVIQAEAMAKAQVAKATAQATSTRLAGDAEADAIQAKGDALRANPALVELVAAERWNGQLPTTMIPGSTVPFINMQ
jgi:regulator of protease activity HflC (stomatin/prohibitin superfamily)